MKREKFFLAAAVAALTVLLGTALVLGQQQDGGPGAQEQTAVSAIVSPLLQYQARLSDPATGDPVSDGTYTITFRLYAAPSGGQPLWSEVKDVPVQNGLLSVLLGDTTALDQGLFSGGALWLGIKVGADSETVPRQQMVPVAYALSLVPGAEIEANSSKAALTLGNSGGDALSVQGPVSITGDLNLSGSLVGGAHSHSNYVDWYSFDDHIYGGMHHERYTSAEAVSAIKAADGSGSGLDADLLDGKDAGTFAATGHSHAALPIAYGIIRHDGAIYSATPNVSSSYNSAGKYFEISIAGHYYVETSYVTLITAPGVDEIGLASSGGKMRVSQYSASGVPLAQPNFWHFAIFKP